MFYSIQTHIHIDTSSYENVIKHVTYHHRDMPVFHSFLTHLGAEGYTTQWSFVP